MKKYFFFFLLLSYTCQVYSQSPAKDTRMEWWRDAKFGLFIHWGIYAVPAGEYNGKSDYAEWIMTQAKIPIPEYEKFAGQFNPEKFNAEDWVLMAKNAGMKYIVITSKHHDGFCLWDSKVSDYDIMDRTPFKRDVMKELSDACKKHGVVFCMYHSIMDWHHPDENKTNIAKYREEYLKPQLKELVTKYDPGVLWFDGEWVDEWTTSQGDSLYNWLRKLKPDLIINNRVSKGRDGMKGMNKINAAGDFGTPEQEILDTKSSLDWESCMTMNNHWGYNKNDNNWKTTHQLIWNLVDIIAKGGNYLLNVGPTAEGLFPDSSISRLKEIGEWMKINSEAIYRIKTWNYHEQGENIRYAADRNGNIYAYYNFQPGEKLIFRKIKLAKSSNVELLGVHKKIEWQQTEEGAVISLPANMNSSSGQVLVFKLKGTPQILAAAPQIGTTEEAKTKYKVIAAKSEQVTIINKEKNAAVHYTTDGSIPSKQSPLYSKPVAVSQTTVIKAVAYSSAKMPSDISELKIIKGKYAITLNSTYAPQYAAFGPVTLVDALFASEKNYHKEWLGFEGTNLEAIIDLGEEKPFNKVSGSFLKNQGEWIFLPVKFKIYISNTATDFKLLGEETEMIPQQLEETGKKIISVNKQATARYIKIVAETIGHCPAWHPGNGGKAWVFADEIIVE